MDDERKKKLLDTMKQFNKDNKNEILSFGNEAEDVETISTGIVPIDMFIGGGYKKGTFTVIYGGQSVGKSTLVLQAIATAQKEGKICCYIDLEHSFSKERALTLGINLDELILAEKCETAEHALEIIRKPCKEKVIDLVVVDSVQAMSPLNERENKGKERELASREIAELARTLSKFFRVVAPDVFNAKASVVMIGQIRIGGIGSFYTHAEMSGGEGIKHWANTRLFLRRGQRTDAPIKKFKNYYLDPESKLCFETVSDDVGFDAVLKLEKTKSSKSAKENSEIHIPFLYDRGFVNEYIANDNVDIRIDPDSPIEEQDKIRNMLIDKKILPEVAENVVEITEAQPVTVENQPEVVIPVKKRGRPKKEAI
jgi:protein RecA